MTQPLCETCALPHPPMTPCVDVQRIRMRELLLRIGQVDRCKSCRASIIWITHATGRKAPYNDTGLIHFTTCPSPTK